MTYDRVLVEREGGGTYLRYMYCGRYLLVSQLSGASGVVLDATSVDQVEDFEVSTQFRRARNAFYAGVKFLSWRQL